MNLEEYDPSLIPYQLQCIRDIKTSFDYSSGPMEILCSGAIGSGKTTLLAHLIAVHMIQNDNALVGLGRLSLKYLKDTLFNEVITQLGDIPHKVNYSTGTIELTKNKSKAMCFSWSDKQYKKVRSYQFSMFAIEELTETNTEEMYNEIYSRLGRRSDIDECFLISATNPDEPDHWVYERFIGKPSDRKIVYYSKTEDNQLLPEAYLKNLRATMDPMMARRMLEGEWLSISKEVLYHQMSDQNVMQKKLTPNPNLPIWISWDFNIGVGKPMSVCLGQFINGHAFMFDEVILDGMRTVDTLEELNERGYFDGTYSINVCADATGSHRDTRGVKDDIIIIRDYIANVPARVPFRMMVPKSNPPIRTRHNLVNSYLCNAEDERRLHISPTCKTIVKGLRLTKLKKSGSYQEDDSMREQHVTTALGYMLYQMDRSTKKTGVTQGRR